MLNRQFTSVFTKENLTNIPDKGVSPHNVMHSIRITVKGVEKCIKRLNVKKACGPDKMPIKVIKETEDIIAPILTSLYQQSLDTSEIPSDWKEANIVPIYKKSDRSKPANYRPVSLTAVASKMLEHIVVSQIMDHLDNNKILNENQHGFRAKRSCETQLLMTTDDITRNMDNGTQVDMAILDFAKAFDKVSHRRLSTKLLYYGIGDTTLKWIEEFLHNRTQQVLLDGAVSTTAPVTSGVPQGTVLGPTLFLIFINDIADTLNSTVRLFADDCVIYRPINDHNDHVILQSDLESLAEWSNRWQMQFNIDKCAIMQITTKCNKKQFAYSMHNQNLQTVHHHPYLGLELSDTMKYNLHISTITNKASSVLGFLKRNMRHCPKKIKERAYQSLVRPKLEYSSTIWNPHQVTQSKQVEQVQRNAARFVLNKAFNHEHPGSVSAMIGQLEWPSLEQRRRTADVTLLYKVMNHLVAVPANYCPTLATVRSTRHSHQQKLNTFQCSINAYRYSFFPRTVSCWNHLPETAVTAASLDDFKCAIQHHAF